MNILKYTIGILITLTVGWVVGYLSPRAKKANDGHSDTTTVITYDTVSVYQPQPSATSIIGNFVVKQVPILLALNDTIREPYYVGADLIIPREQKYYSTSQYKAWISGYNPRLDSIMVYNTTKTTTVEHTAQKGALNGFSIEARLMVAPSLFVPSIGARFTRDGFFAEAGALYYKNINPYLQVGYSFALFR